MKLLAGQKSLLGDPPILYCRRCGRKLIGDRARAKGIGTRCRTAEIREAKLVQRLTERFEKREGRKPSLAEAALMVTLADVFGD